MSDIERIEQAIIFLEDDSKFNVGQVLQNHIPIAITALQEKLAREQGCDTTRNAPLTLDELRGMVGEPVWIASGKSGRWCILGRQDSFRQKFQAGSCRGINGYGKTWLAYRRKPKEEV